jgi:hypothetical chaperone protein
MERHVGLDFGTTNTTLALADAGGEVTVARFGEPSRETFRSILHFLCAERRGEAPAVEAGPAAIARWLETGGDGRLIQSVKSFLASRAFRETVVCDQPWTLEDMVSLILRRLRQDAEARLGPLGRRAAAGRPAHFAGQGRAADDALAEARLRRALERAGFEDIVFVLEPVAAAWHYEQGLDHEELVLIADLGGGTSDFSLLSVGPRARKDRGTAERPVLASDGVGVAGDAFDAEVVRHLVSPALGRGTRYETTKGLEIPTWLYAHLEQWHTLSMLKTPRTLQLLRRLAEDALEPEKLAALVHLVEYDLGFALHEAVDAAKTALSGSDETTFVLDEPPIRIRARLTRADFERWIERELAAIGACADRTLAAAGADARAVDRVFLTGGSSFVPAVRRIFETRFGAERLKSGGEFVSVARGLATGARDVFGA